MGLKRDHVLSIRDPKVGIVNVAGADGEKLAQEDAKYLNGIFPRVRTLQPANPGCDVLYMYASIASGGSIRDSPESVRDIIRVSKAPIVVIANANEVDCYAAAFKGKASRANLVMTLDRRGESFARFFTKLFMQMKAGVSMPNAWVALNPQSSSADADAPSCIFSCEVGHITFSLSASE